RCPCAIASSLLLFCTRASAEIYAPSLHDALPILHHEVADDVAAFGNTGLRELGLGRHSRAPVEGVGASELAVDHDIGRSADGRQDRKSTRLNSSHVKISYAVFCLKKEKDNQRNRR